MRNHEGIFDIPEGRCKNVMIEVHDVDKHGRDKLIGNLDLQDAEIVNIEGQEGKWFPLSGVKSGQVLPSADLLDALGYNVNGVPSSMLGRNDSNLLQSNDNNSSYPTGVELPHGKAGIHVIKAKELSKADMIGKSDPYVVLSYGKQNQKTKELEPKLGACIDEIYKHPLQDERKAEQLADVGPKGAPKMYVDQECHQLSI